MSEYRGIHESRFSGIIAKKMAALMFGTACIFTGTQANIALADTENVAFPAGGTTYNAPSNTGTVGAPGGSAGASYVFITDYRTTPDQNIVSVSNGVIIAGGGGGWAPDGNGSDAGHGGIGISGSNLTINNNAWIRGGGGGRAGNGDVSGWGGAGGHGGIGISGSNLTINNYATIDGGGGGDGGIATNAAGGAGGNGGDGISGSNLTIINYDSIRGGGGSGGAMAYSAGGYGIGGDSGHGGNGINSSGSTIANNRSGTIQGGDGHRGGDSYTGGAGGNGGHGISGNHLTITNSGFVFGGNGGNGGWGRVSINTGVGGSGGDGISGSNLSISNRGMILGGNGGNGGNSGQGGAGISSSGGVITNNSGGTIQGGSGGAGISNGDGGNGGDAIYGSNLTISNSDAIIRGEGGAGDAGGTSGDDGAAIRLESGINNLTLKSGSDITGDVVLSGMQNATDTNTLTIISEAETTITGNLAAGAYTGVSLSGKTVTFTEDARFGDNTSLTFGSFGDGTALKANNLSFSDTDIKGSSNITNWSQTNYTLATATGALTGDYNDKTENALLTDGAKNYAHVIVTNGDKDLSYALKWNDVANNAEDAYGTFSLKEGAALTLGVVMADNTTVMTGNNANGWDGRSLTKDGIGTLILNAKNTYTGATIVGSGTLKTGVVDAFASTSGVGVNPGATLNLGGNSQMLGTDAILHNAGTVLINDWDASLLTSPVVITGSMLNSGLVVINNCTTCAGQTLEVDGNWVGNNGTVSFGTVLGNDTSMTDKLVITGDASGTTKVLVNNENGSGDKTLEGIELITTNSSTDDAFVQGGRIVAGSYDYSLQKGNKSGENISNWYLTSKLRDNGGDTYRPEVGGYASNLAAATTMFNSRLNDRQGEGYYVDPATGDRRASNIWLRYEGTHGQNHMIDGQLNNKVNRTVFQMGGDVLGGSFNDNDLWRLGVMGGYGHQNTATRNTITDHRSDAKMHGYSVGFYGTWYQNGLDHSGLYVDSWVLYNWFDNTIKGDDLRWENYKSKGFSASIEGGYNFLAGTVDGLSGVANNVFIRPQGQVIWSGVRADDHTELNGTKVVGLGHNNVQTRLGIRMSLSPVDRQASYSLEPFIEANWLYNSKKHGVDMGGVSSFIEGSRNLGEIKLGVEGKFNDNFSAWGTIGHQMGSDSYRETQGVIGVKYRF